jgi:transcriptional regulator with XRE-family HTH domain
MKQVSQQSLAEEMSLSLRQVSRWEKGGSDSVNQEALVRAIVFLGVPLEHLSKLISSEYIPQEEINYMVLEALTNTIPQVKDDSSVNENDFARVMEYALKLRDDRPLLIRWIEYARKLLQNKD